MTTKKCGSTTTAVKANILVFNKVKSRSRETKQINLPCTWYTQLSAQRDENHTVRSSIILQVDSALLLLCVQKPVQAFDSYSDCFFDETGVKAV